MDRDIEIPQYFICPISLQIMKDPVTAITGITYDRESIEHWLFKGKNSTICPVTRQPLPRDSDLTPNHTLRRLIQVWCTENSANGIDRIPTPKAPLDKFHIIKLIKDLWNPQLQVKTLMQLEVLAAENERNRKYMAEVGVPRAMLTYIVTCYDKSQVCGLEESLSILHFFEFSSEIIMKLTAVESVKIIDSFTWVIGCDEIENHKEIKSHALILLKNIIEAVSVNIIERLKPDFFQKIIGVLRQRVITQQGIHAALHVVLEASPFGRNRLMMVDYGAVFELIELELAAPKNKKTTELVLGILFHLCSCADGRGQFLSHRAAVAVVTRRIMQVSPAADDWAISILLMICKFSGNYNLVVQEMLRVGTVLKLFSFLQADCAAYLKDKAREILRSHYDEWKDSPCVDASVLTTLTR